jgi:hypothetical protein
LSKAENIRPPAASSRLRLAILAGTLAVSLGALTSSGADAAPVPIMGGTFSGKTSQESVANSFRNLKFTVKRKKRKVTLTLEPTIARGDCFSTPMFTLGGETPTAKLNAKGVFSFTRTFIGSKIDKIKGRFVSPTQIKGTLVYWFADQDLCYDGRVKARFKASR